MKKRKGRKRSAAKGSGRKKGRVKPGATKRTRVRRAASTGGARRASAAKSAARRGAPAAVAANSDLELEAAVLRRLLRHFDERKDVQNIELMILAGFCRNCLSRWFVEAAQERGLQVDIERAREKIYGMPYSQWKERHQPPATEDQLRRFGEVEQRKQAAGAAASKE